MHERLLLERRVTSLERRNRMLTVLVIGLMLIGVIAAGDPPAASRAGAFQLVDAAGAVRAELGFRDGNPGLFLMDEEGRDRLAATHEADGTGLYVKDAEGTTRIGVAQFAHGGGGVALHGPGSRGAAVLYLKGEGSLRFFDPDGKVTNAVLSSPDRER